MKWNILVLLVVLNAVKDSSCASQNDEYCYSNDPDKKQAKFYSTKTAYEVSRGSEKKYFTVPSEFILRRTCLNINFAFYYSGCEPAKFWLLSRHGTRLPSASGIKNLRSLTDVSLTENLFESWF